MPYIKQEEREELDLRTQHLANAIETPGQLNYTITKIIKHTYGLGVAKMRYQDFNEIMGVLECVKQELYRRQIVPFEIQKMEENGDVF